jgi:polysaccharide pyruvyl transferase WcaK-like protein
LIVAWTSDPYWLAASRAALDALSEADVVLVPQEFLELHAQFAPLEFSWGLAIERMGIAFCCSKEDVDRIAPALREAASSRTGGYRWANEVFVLGGNFRWSTKSTFELSRHLGYWQTKVSRYGRGIPSRQAQFRPIPVPDDVAAAGPRVLVVGASGMGNIGDDLLAHVIAGLCYEAGASQVVSSGPDVDPLHLHDFDAVIVGGGGLIYASRDGQREWQNLANYLRLGPTCRQQGLPVAMIGVGDQDHAHGIERDSLAERFARDCLPSFDPVTVRDEDSASLLRNLGVARLTAGSDLLFLWAAQAARAPRPHRVGAARMALAGELFAYPSFVRTLDELAASGSDGLQGREFDFLVMSEDDVQHAQPLRSLFAKIGASVAVVDLRGHAIDSLVYQFASLHGLITTRFHGLVLAALAGLPVLALDQAQGKKSRLLKALGAPAEMLVDRDDTSPETVRRIAEALQGAMLVLDSKAVAAEAQRGEVHRVAVKELMSRAKPRPFRGKAVRTASFFGFDLRKPLIAKKSAEQSQAPLTERLVAGGEVGLCWAASTPETLGYGNLGDSLSAVIVAALSGLVVRHVAFNAERTKLVAVGSIGHAVRGGEAVMWGCGVSIRGGVLPRNVPVTRYDVRAIRGEISADHLRGLGVKVPEVYGDPVWFLPSIFDEPIEKKYELGVIPHIQDIQGFGPGARPPAESLRYVLEGANEEAVVLINTWHEPTWEGLAAKLRLILSCKRIVSQSFHGVVIAEAYRIPVLNFRALAGAANGAQRISLGEECTTDPRVWEFFKGGRRAHFDMYVQRRDQRTDWSDVIGAVDARWEPFDYDPSALAESFPLPLAYDPLKGRANLNTIKRQGF